MERTRRSTKCLDSQDGITLVRDGVGPLLSRCLSLDLEVGVQDRRIHVFAGVRPDTGQTLTFPSKGDVTSPRRWPVWTTFRLKQTSCSATI